MDTKPSVAEAWEPFGSLKRRMGKAQAQDAARGVMLAVLDKTVAVVTHGNDLGAFECSDCTWGIGALRAEIEALGR